MKSFFQEFKKFISKGNVMDLAVGIIIGGAFTAIVNSLVSDLINPLIGLLGGLDLSEWKIVFSEDNALNYGNFIMAVINFLIVAFVLFVLIKSINKVNDLAKKKEEEKPKEARICPYCKSEIHDEATRCPHCTSQLE